MTIVLLSISPYLPICPKLSYFLFKILVDYFSPLESKNIFKVIIRVGIQIPSDIFFMLLEKS